MKTVLFRHTVLFLSTLTLTFAWSSRFGQRLAMRTVLAESESRRHFLAGLIVGAGSISTLFREPNEAQATLTEENKIFTAGKPLTVGFAKDRFKLAEKDIQYLLDHYDEICDGGGDNVRRYLGTVGTNSGLFGIQKVLKTLQDEADDFVSFTEDMNEFNSYLAGAEGAAYSAIFVVTSSSSTPPQKYFDDAKRNVKKMKYHMENMARELKL